MSCTKYNDFELGLIEAEKMKKHLETCAECRRQAALDDRLTHETASLRRPVDDAGLWDRIEARLLEEANTARGNVMGTESLMKRSLIFFRTAGVAAIALAAVGLAVWLLFLRPSPGTTSGLIADAALARVETEEREYAAAIEELEAKVRPKLGEIDFSLMALYRDRLETIDAQIERCRDAIAKNPCNAHVRKYLLAALRDKKETLGQILSQQ
jgi:hypothetical protein